MRKIMPCSKCGVAVLKTESQPYALSRYPASFSCKTSNLRYRCRCGTVNEITRAQFASIPDSDLTVAG